MEIRLNPRKGVEIGDVTRQDGKLMMVVAIGPGGINREEVRHSPACERGWINESALSCLACHIEELIAEEIGELHR